MTTEQPTKTAKSEDIIAAEQLVRKLGSLEKAKRAIEALKVLKKSA